MPLQRTDFSALYEAHYGPVASYVWRRTGDRAWTEELAAETFLRAYKSLAQYSGHVPVRNWLLGIAANTVSREQRRRHLESDMVWEAQRSAETTSGPETEPHRSVDAGDELRRVRAAIETLPGPQQAVLTLSCFEGLAAAEIAAALSIAVGTVKSRLSRAREALRHELRSEGRHGKRS